MSCDQHPCLCWSKWSSLGCKATRATNAHTQFTVQRTIYNVGPLRQLGVGESFEFGSVNGVADGGDLHGSLDGAWPRCLGLVCVIDDVGGLEDGPSVAKAGHLGLERAGVKAAIVCIMANVIAFEMQEHKVELPSVSLQSQAIHVII